jgi:hypothetical protein
MAYIPNDAMRRKRQLTPAAWDVYETLCALAGPDPGFVEGAPAERNARLVEWTQRRPGSVKNALVELRRVGWVVEEGRGLRLLVGDFSQVPVVPKEQETEEPRAAIRSDESASCLKVLS